MNVSEYAKAISLSSMLYDSRSIRIVENASNSDKPILKVTAAMGASNLVKSVAQSGSWLILIFHL